VRTGATVGGISVFCSVHRRRGQRQRRDRSLRRRRHGGGGQAKASLSAGAGLSPKLDGGAVSVVSGASAFETSGDVDVATASAAPGSKAGASGDLRLRTGASEGKNLASGSVSIRSGDAAAGASGAVAIAAGSGSLDGFKVSLTGGESTQQAGQRRVCRGAFRRERDRHLGLRAGRDRGRRRFWARESVVGQRSALASSGAF
jgi:hypothetical protein